MKIFSVLLFLFSSVSFAGPVVQWGPNQTAKLYQNSLNFSDLASFLTGTDDPTSVAKDAPKGSLYLRYGSGGGLLYSKQDDGSSTNWSVFPTGSSGITSLNGLSGASQTFAAGTSGSDFAISSSSTTHTFNLPTASASNRGALSSANWSTFNAKEPAITAGTSSQYYRGDKTMQTLDTLAVVENTNLYYTQGRFDSAFAAKNTGGLSEGSNLYYTQARFDSALAAKSTSNLSEGSNLYYTAARVQSTAKSGTSAQEFHVSKDAGNDANDCSILKPCKTIGAGITAANAVGAYYSQAIVYVSPSTGTSSYNENITLSQQGVNLQCVNPVQNTRACVINGTVTVNLTGVAGGASFNATSNEVYINGFVVTGGASSALTFSGSTFQRLVLVNSYIQSSSASALSASNDASSGGIKSTLAAYDTTYENNSASNATINQTGGRVWNFGTQGTIMNDNAAGHSLDQSGTTSFVANINAITGEANITDNTANATFNLSTITSGSNPCIVTPSSPNTGIITIAYFGCTSTATNSITGSGVVFTTPSNVRLSSSGDIISTVTQGVVPGFPQGEVMIGAGATTGTNVLLSLLNGHIKIAQTTKPTATVGASAGTGAACTITNGSSDTWGVVNLTTGSVGTPATGTQCTVNFNKAYGAAPHCFLFPKSAAAASNLVQVQMGTETIAGFPFTFNVSGATSGTYNYNYICGE